MRQEIKTAGDCQIIGPGMRHTSRSDTYRASATECAALAEVVNNPRGKAMLLIMAEAWLRLADYVEQQQQQLDQPCENRPADIRSGKGSDVK